MVRRPLHIPIIASHAIQAYCAIAWINPYYFHGFTPLTIIHRYIGNYTTLRFCSTFTQFPTNFLGVIRAQGCVFYFYFSRFYLLTFFIGYYKIASSNETQGDPPMYTDVLTDWTEAELLEIDAVEDYEDVS